MCLCASYKLRKRARGMWTLDVRRDKSEGEACQRKPHSAKRHVNRQRERRASILRTDATP